MTEGKKDSEKNLTDTSINDQDSVKDTSALSSYNKAEKLVTALFMVTDIMDKSEPLRHKLREIGTEILSDIYSNSSKVSIKVKEVISFLDIASTIGMISEMNKNILKKEFMGLKNFLEQKDSFWLQDLIDKNSQIEEGRARELGGDSYKTRLGVQKGSTLMTALHSMSDINTSTPKIKNVHKNENFDLVKKSRREEILNIIKGSKEALANGGITITDIINEAKNSSSGSVITDSSEKTLQRELVAMVKDNVLKKTGEKRWSRYFLPKY